MSTTCCSSPIGTAASLGLLLLRLVVGAAFVLHGWPKIQNPMAWMGPDSPVPGALQALAAAGEFLGGLGLIVGLLSRVAAFGVAAVMVGALVMVHLPAGHPFVGKPGAPSYEVVVVYLAAAILFVLTGPGCCSVDACLFRRRNAALAGPAAPGDTTAPR